MAELRDIDWTVADVIDGGALQRPCCGLGVKRQWLLVDSERTTLAEYCPRNLPCCSGLEDGRRRHRLQVGFSVCSEAKVSSPPTLEIFTCRTQDMGPADKIYRAYV